MKLIRTDNFARETESESLIAENITNKEYAIVMENALNERYSGQQSSFFCKIVEDDYKLWRGMEEFT